MPVKVRLMSFRNELLGSAQSYEISPKESVQKEKTDSAFEGQFKATRKWNGIIRRFRNGMPKKRHRRQLKIYEDCFTGREAVDFLMNELPKFTSKGKDITRSNCMLLLEKFMGIGLLSSVRGNTNEHEVKENEIYRFTEMSVERLAATPVLVRRAASFNGRNSFGNSATKNETPVSHTRPENDILGERMLPARIAIPSACSNSSLARSRRISSSHGNLPSMLRPSVFDSVETVTSTQVEIDFKIKEEGEDETLDNKENNFSSLDKVISELRRVGEEDEVLPNNCIRKFGKIIQRSSPNSDERAINSSKKTNCSRDGHASSAKCYTSANKISPKRASHGSTEIDIYEIWKDALLMRLQKVLRIENFNEMLGFDISGSNIKWNCEKVGRKGIVHVREQDDELSSYLVARMRFLMRWPFDEKFKNLSGMYAGIEHNVFLDVCEHFVKGCPLLPNDIAAFILKIVSIIRSRSSPIRLASPMRESDGHLETEFSEGDTPITRFVNVTRRAERPLSADIDVAFKSLENISDEFVRFARTRNSVAAPPSSYRLPSSVCQKEENYTADNGASPALTQSSSEDGDSLFARYESVLSRLPGLARSPELLQRLEELTRGRTPVLSFTPPNAATAISSSLMKTPRLGLSPLIANIAQQDESDLLESVALVLLALNPPVRRRLHYLLKFMQRICKNHCLRLDFRRENRYVVLENLSESVLMASESISAVQCLHLVTFLVDNQNEVFAVPEGFKNDVDTLIVKRLSEKVSVSKVNDEDCPSGPVLQYCEPIKPAEYEEQKEKGTEGYLLGLLDSILENKKLSPEEQKKQLKKFKKTYPEIYARRFPSPKLDSKRPSTPSIFNRLINFRFK